MLKRENRKMPLSPLTEAEKSSLKENLSFKMLNEYKEVFSKEGMAEGIAAFEIKLFIDNLLNSFDKLHYAINGRSAQLEEAFFNYFKDRLDVVVKAFGYYRKLRSN